MGCDIHLYREKLEDGAWVSADEWEDVYGAGADVPFEKRFTDRNYNLFSILADVRTRCEPPAKFEPRGMPLRLSFEVAEAFRNFGCGCHSYSHLYLSELIELRDLLASRMYTVSGMKDADQLTELQASIQAGKPNWDLLYPYCQGTNDPKQVRFKLDVPADFIVGGSLNRIIESLQEIGGDNQRIVFWFDN